MASRSGQHDWSDLSDGMKRYYKNQGVGAATYNKWWRLPQTERTQLSIEARQAGYRDGLNFLAVQSAVKNKAPRKRTIKPTTPSNQAAVDLISGSRGAQNAANRKLVAQLFDFSEFDRVDWENFLSP